MKLIFTLSLLFAAFSIHCQTLYPVGSPPGVHYNSPVNSINEAECLIKDPASNNLYVGGSFTVAGGSTANNIAMWNGASWSTLGTGMNDRVHEIVFFQGNIIAGGGFTSAGGNAANRIAMWNGTSWSQMGSGFNGEVWALGVYNGTLFAGGDFTSSGATPVARIAQWNGTSWVAVGAGFSSGLVHELVQVGNDLFIGGESLPSGNQVWKWNGGAIVMAGSNTVNQICYRIIVHNNEVYTTGDQDGLNPYTPSKLVSGTWVPMAATGFAAGIYGIHSFNGQIYVGTNDNAIPCLWRYNGNSWVSVAGGVQKGQFLNSHVWDFETINGDLYFGGRFQNVGGASLANNVGRFNTPPAPTASFTPPQNACAGSCFTFTDLSVNTPTSWAWSFPGASVVSSTLQNPTNICYSSSGTYTVTLAANNVNGTGVLQQTFAVAATPGAAGAVSGATIFCEGLVQTYSVPAITGATGYTWSLPNGWTGSSNTNTISATTSSNSGNVNVSGGNACGTSTATALNVTVNPSPVITPSSNVSLLCSGSSATLSAGGAASYTWNPGGAGTSIVISPTINTTYTVTGTSLAGCQGSATILQSVDPCTSIPEKAALQNLNVFPNPAKGLVEIKGITGLTQVKVISLIGTPVYTKTLDKQDNTLNLEELQKGIYFVKFTTATGEFSVKLIRE